LGGKIHQSKDGKSLLDRYKDLKKGSSQQ